MMQKIPSYLRAVRQLTAEQKRIVDNAQAGKAAEAKADAIIRRQALAVKRAWMRLEGLRFCDE